MIGYMPIDARLGQARIDHIVGQLIEEARRQGMPHFALIPSDFLWGRIVEYTFVCSSTPITVIY